MARPWMIYGANGYTGRLIAREAVARGHRPILAGRNAEAIHALADELNCEPRALAIDSADAIAERLGKAGLVVNCAGPFSATAQPMMDACLRHHAHYCDITGEIECIESGHARDAAALDAGVTIMPAVGFDVVPSDCLAATLAARLPGAMRLELAFAASGGLSRGTLKTMFEGLPSGGRARIAGQIRRVPAAWKAREIPFRSGSRWCVTIPWGDVASAYYSTGIGNIEVYTAASRRRVRTMRWLRPLLPLAGLGFVQRWLKARVDAKAPGPSQAARESSRCSLWGRVSRPDGASLSGTLETPGGYPLTVETTLAVVERILAGDFRPGFQTASMAYGTDFITKFAGVSLEIEGRDPASAPAGASAEHLAET